ncbi:MAG TPA: hypothetical protein VLO30_06345 [Chthoniobacterales bacterium]|nr:hypothetical protein [Chthoniobacterales bacterium]
MAEERDLAPPYVSSDLSEESHRISQRVENLRRKASDLLETLERVQKTLEEVRAESKE